MKKLLILHLCCLMASASIGQWITSEPNIYNSNSGNVGIGITNPVAKLQISSAGGTNSGLLVQSTSAGSYATVDWKNNNGDLAQMAFTGSSFTNGIFVPNSAVFNSSGSGGFALAAYHTSGAIKFATGGFAASNERMRISADGNVGIGTTSPGPYKLAVEGTIGARKVKVTQVNPWADYVFNDDYPLMSLKELDNYIHKNRHLPDVPSAAEVEKNGLDLGDNQATLLRKIEELTLYIIDQNKKLEEQQKRIEALEQKTGKKKK